MAFGSTGGGRRELSVKCTGCGHISLVPPSAIARNQFFCGSCGKPMDLMGQFRQMVSSEAANTTVRRDRVYKSARKGRR